MSAPNPVSSLNAVPSCTISFGGSEIPASYEIQSITVRQSVNRISRASVTLLGGDSHLNTFKEIEDDLFKPGQDVSISLGFDQDNQKVFSGVVAKIGLRILPGYERAPHKSMLIIECADKALALTLGKKSDIYENQTDSDIISSILSDAGLTKTVDATTVTHTFMSRYNATDWAFIQKRARANGLVIFNADNTVTVTAPKVSGSAAAEIIYGDGALAFDGEVDASEQLASVEGASWDPFKEEDLSASGAEPAEMSAPGNLDGSTLADVFAPKPLTVHYDAPVETSELKALADAALTESRLLRVRGSALFRGMNAIKLGGIVTLTGFGSRLAGNVLVTGVEHRLEQGTYTTRIGFGLPRELSGRLIQEENPALPEIRGLYAGTVKAIDGDPNDQYRVQVMIPALKNSGDGIWAMMSQFYATSSAGSFFYPETGSEVIVGFMHGDPRFPVILGSLYNSKNAPAETPAQANPKKSIISAKKLTLEFDDENKVLTLKTPGGNTIEMDDSGGITVKDSNGNSIKMASSGVTIDSAGSLTLKASQGVSIEGATGIDLKASGGDVTMKGLNVTAEAQIKFSGKGTAQAELNGSGQVTVQGGIVMIN